MTKTATARASTAKRRATANAAVAPPARKGKHTLKAALARSFQGTAGSAVTAFVFPRLSGGAAAELMEAAGILTPSGKLTKPYR